MPFQIVVAQISQIDSLQRIVQSSANFLDEEEPQIEREKYFARFKASWDSQQKFEENVLDLIQKKSDFPDIATINTDPGEEGAGPNKKGQFYRRGPSQFDSRIEPYMLTEIVRWQNSLLKSLEGVGVLMLKEKLSLVNDSIFMIDLSVRVGDRYRLCDSEPFVQQPTAGQATAFLIEKDKMLTAYHSLQEPLDSYVVVFGYQLINSLGVVNNFVPRNKVFEIQRLLYEDELAVYDVALLQLQRPAGAQQVLSLQEGTPVNEGLPVYAIGYPLGIPQKVALNASVKDVYPTFFTSSLDVFQGNSGSPVFSFESHKVIGILLSGMQDFHYAGGCWKSYICRGKDCGEKVLQLNFLKDYFK